MRDSDALLEMLLEIQQLDRVPRLGFALRGVTDPESVSEHSFHVALLVWILSSEIPGIDLGRALELALVHDLAEIRTGDLPLTASRYLPEGSKGSAESKALADLTAPLGNRASALASEYHQGATLEARTVKACDKLQLLLKVAAYERAGAAGLSEFWNTPGNLPQFGVERVDELVRVLHHRCASRSA